MAEVEVKRRPPRRGGRGSGRGGGRGGGGAVDLVVVVGEEETTIAGSADPNARAVLPTMQFLTSVRNSRWKELPMIAMLS